MKTFDKANCGLGRSCDLERMFSPTWPGRAWTEVPVWMKSDVSKLSRPSSKKEGGNIFFSGHLERTGAMVSGGGDFLVLLLFNDLLINSNER